MHVHPSASSLLLTWLILPSHKALTQHNSLGNQDHSCVWPVVTEEVARPCCHQRPLLHHTLHHFCEAPSCFLTSGTVLSEDNSKPQTQRSWLLVTFCLPAALQAIMCLHTQHAGGKSLPHTLSWGQEPPFPPPSSASFLSKLWRANVSLGTQLLFVEPLYPTQWCLPLVPMTRSTVSSPLCPLP